MPLLRLIYVECQWKRGVKTIPLIKYCFQRTAENTLVPALWGKREKLFDVFFLTFQPLQAAQFVFPVANCPHADENQLVQR